MNEKKEEAHLAKLYNNFMGTRVDDWITLAKICKDLVGYYGSHDKLAKKVGVSREKIRSTIKLLDLPPKVQELVRKGLIKQDVAWRIASVKGKENQIRIANEVQGLDVHSARELVYYFTQNPSISLAEYKQKILNSRDRTENISIIVLPLPKNKFEDLRILAKKHYMTPQKLISELIDDVLKKGRVK